MGLDGISRLVSAHARRALGNVVEDVHGALAVSLLVLTYMLVLLVLICNWAEKRNIPSSAVAILVGATMGGILRLTGAEQSPMLAHDMLANFDEELFLYLLLPPIIFEAGYSLCRRRFFANIGTIFTFAVLGTLLSTFIIGQSCQMAGVAGWFTTTNGDALDFSTPLDSYLFGALISATDPVATLSIMGAVNADPVVYTLIFGESVLNDAVAIVLVRILQTLGPSGFKDPSAYVGGILQFFIISLGSILAGLVVSALSALLLRKSELSHHPGFELSLIILFGYCSYCTAEALGCSGILALFFAGVLIGHYHVHVISPPARAACGIALKSAAHLSETAVFAYMGLDLFSTNGAGFGIFTAATPPPGANEGSVGGVGELSTFSKYVDIDSLALLRFITFAVAIVLIARVIVVIPLCFLVNCFRTSKISSKMGGVLVFAGLRGAIAFALARNVDSVHRHSIAGATTATILFTTFVLGGSTRWVLRSLGMADREVLEEPLAGDGGMSSSSDTRHLPSSSSGQQPHASDRFSERWLAFDMRVLQPIFGRGPPAERAKELHAAEGGDGRSAAMGTALDVGGAREAQSDGLDLEQITRHQDPDLDQIPPSARELAAPQMKMPKRRAGYSSPPFDSSAVEAPHSTTASAVEARSAAVTNGVGGGNGNGVMRRKSRCFAVPAVEMQSSDGAGDDASPPAPPQ